MKLLRLSIDRLPGLRAGFELEALSPGLNVIVGPNGSGKSSLCRAVRALLWEEEPFRGAVSSEWLVGEEPFLLARETGAGPRGGAISGAAVMPTLPEARFRRCFTLSVDDFLTDFATDREIGREIKKELSAGFDLGAVLADKRGKSAQSGGAPQKAAALREAGREVRRVQETHQALAQEERGLEELRAEKGQASAAQRARQRHEDARELAEARVRVREAQVRLAGFAAATGELHGDEDERLRELRTLNEESETELRAARRRIAAARAEIEAAALAAAVPVEDLENLAGREQRLRALEGELQRTSELEARAATSLADANRALHLTASDGDTPDFTADRWPELERGLREREEHTARVRALNAEIELYHEKEIHQADPPFEAGMRALARWLEAGVGTGSRARYGAWTTIGSGLLLVLAGMAMITFESTPWWLLVATGVGLLVFGASNLWLGAKDPHQLWEREYVGLGFDSPDEWTSDQVVTRLARLQQRSEAHKLRGLRHGLAKEKRAQLARARVDQAGAEARFAELCARCSLPADTAALRLVEIASFLEQRTRAADELSRAQASRLERRAVRGRELDAANEILARHGGAAASDATDLQHHREGLASRERRRARAEQQLAAASAEGARYADQLGRRRARLTSFFEVLGLEVSDGRRLTDLLQQHAAWQDARERLDGADLVVRTLETRLADHPELCELSVEEARLLSDSNDEFAAQLEGLTGEIARIEAEVETTRAGHDLERALAAEQLAHETLEEVREELLESAAADFLVETVALEHQNLAQPDILRRANELFGRFTRHRYRLVPSARALADGPGFEVRETDGLERAIGELSSGTLSQLRLALRLAVAQEVERGESLPFLFDEALTNSDPVRFREVALALGDLVEDGRQVVFLTADPDDARRLVEALAERELPPVGRYDLAELSGERAQAPSLETIPLSEISAPEAGEAAAAYGERLRVPAIDPFLGVDALHAFYLGSTNPLTLYRVLAERVETVGQVRELLAVHPRELWDESTRRRFEASRAVAAAWLEAYRIGRAPRLLPEILREGPAGATKYIDDLVEIAVEQEGDAKRLFEVLEAKERDSRLKGFRAAKVEALREDLEERGFYSPLDPLSAETMQGCALSAARSYLADEAIDREGVYQLVRAFEGWLGVGD